MKDKTEIPSHSFLLVNHKFEHLVGFTCYIGVKQAWTSILSHQNLIIHINQTILDMVFKNGGKKTLKIFTSMISFSSRISSIIFTITYATLNKT